MAEEGDRRVSQRYGELPAEEPSRELDQSILAAAHRAVDKPHAPLVSPAGRHRWYFAFGAVAILLLAVGITLHLERERADPKAAGLEDKPASNQIPAAPSAKPDVRPEEVQERRAMERRARPSQEAIRPERASPSVARSQSPERWLERIVQLRKEGKHDEADRQLAEFRREYPDYKIPPPAIK